MNKQKQTHKKGKQVQPPASKTQSTPSKKSKAPSTGRKILRGIGAAVGGAFGLHSVGSTVGDFVSDIFGLGDYRVKSNSFMLSPSDVPSFNKGSDGSVILEHKEFVTDVKSSISFSSMTFDVNPANTTSFVWLSNIAKSFEEYEFLGLVYAYKPTSGSAIASTNNALGTVILSTEYDVSRAPFTNKVDMESYEFTTSSEPCSAMLHPVECNPNLDTVNSRYIYDTFVHQISDGAGSTSGQSVETNLYDLGRLQVATVGMQAANVVVGELWVTYRVRLLKPRPQVVIYSSAWYSQVAGSLLGNTANQQLFTGLTQNLVSSTYPQAFSLQDSSTIKIHGLKPGVTFFVTFTCVNGGTSTVTNFPSVTVNASIGSSGVLFIDSQGIAQSVLNISGLNTANLTAIYGFFTKDTITSNDGFVIFDSTFTTSAGTGNFLSDVKIETFCSQSMSNGYVPMSLSLQLKALRMLTSQSSSLQRSCDYEAKEPCSDNRRMSFTMVESFPVSSRR